MIIAFASYHGTGKTRLTLDTATLYVRTVSQPALAIDLAYGPSGLVSRCYVDPPGPAPLSEVMLTGASPITWKGIHIAGMDYAGCRALSTGFAADWLKRREDHYGLIIIDAPAWHEWFNSLTAVTDFVFVVAGPEEDWMTSALYLRDVLSQRGLKTVLTLNRVVAWEAVAYGDAGPDLIIPKTDGNLGRYTLPQIIYGWKDETIFDRLAHSLSRIRRR